MSGWLALIFLLRYSEVNIIMAQITIAEVSGVKLKNLEAFLFALGIPFEKYKSSSLNRKLRAARKEKRAGTLKEIDPDNVWDGVS